MITIKIFPHCLLLMNKSVAVGVRFFSCFVVKFKFTVLVSYSSGFGLRMTFSYECSIVFPHVESSLGHVPSSVWTQHDLYYLIME